ncbi:MAG: fibronectin type III domain-containing protein [Bdellovibrionota bacterium]
MNRLNPVLIVMSLVGLLSCKGADSAQDAEKRKETDIVAAVDPLEVHALESSASAIEIAWTAADAAPLTYKISYAKSPTTPSDCSDATSTLTVTSGSKSSVTGLDANSEYNFRICSVSSDGLGVSTGLTASASTLPTCDWTLSSGALDSGTVGNLTFSANADSSDSFTEFNAFLAAAQTAGDSNSDGLKTVCLSDGMTIVNTDALAGTRIEIPGNDFVVYAPTGALARFVNTYTTPADDAKAMGLYANAKSGLRFHNLSIETNGANGVGLYMVNTAVDAATRVISVTHANGADALAFEGSSAVIERLSDFSGTVGGQFGFGLGIYSGAHVAAATRGTIESSVSSGVMNSYGLALAGNGARLDSLTHTSITTNGARSQGIFLTNVVSIGDLEDIVIRTEGEDADGIYMQLGASIEAINHLEIRRASTATLTAGGIVVHHDAPRPFFVTSGIQNVRICSEVGATAWDTAPGQFIAGAGPGGFPYGAGKWKPSTHAAYTGSNPGIETFPFDDPASTAGTDAGIQFGGLCPN